MKIVNKIIKILILTLFIFVFVLVNTPQASATSIPTSFYGTVAAGGVNAPVGSIVKGYVLGNFDGNLTVTSTGLYGGSSGFDPKLSVGCTNCSGGETINFYLKTPAMLTDMIATETATFTSSTQSVNLTIPADDADPTLVTGVNPSTLTYDNTTPTVDIASVGTCIDEAGTINYGMHAITPYQVSYSNGDTSPINCDGTLSYTVSTPWGTENGVSFTGIDNNYYCIKLECQDASGRITTSYSAENIQYDVTKPTISTTSITPDPAKAGTINVVVNFTETGSGLDYSLNPTIEFTPLNGTPVTVTKSTYAANQWTGTATVLPSYNNGTATLSIGGSTDKAGNTMNVNTNATFVIDTIAPSVALSYGADPVKAGVVVITATYSEPVSSVPLISVDQQGTSDISGVAMSGSGSVWTYSYSVVADDGVSYKDGVASVSLSTVADAAGNDAGIPTNASFVIDTIAPSVALSYGADPVKAGVVVITATYSEPVSSVPLISVDQQGTSDISGATMASSDQTVWTYSYSVVADDGVSYKDGVASVSLSTVADAAGNDAGIPTNASFVIDTIAPSVALSYGADPVKAGVVVITATFSETVVNPTISINQQGTTDIDNANMVGGGSVWTYSYTVVASNPNTYIDGDANVSLVASDVAGNNAGTPTNASFVIDTIAPTPPTILNPNTTSVVINIANKASQVIAGSAEVDSIVKLYVNANNTGLSTTATGGSYYFSNANLITAGIVSPTDYSTPKVVTLTATDAAGNESVVSSSVSYIQDTTAPIINSIGSDATEVGVLKVGDSIVFTLTPSVIEVSASISGSYNGTALSWSSSDGNVTFKSNYTVVEGENDQLSPLQLTGVVITDAAGNTSSPADGTDINKTIDANSPVVLFVTSNAVGSGTLKIGDSITFTVDSKFDEAGLTVLPTNYNGGDLNWSTSNGGDTYTASYTVVEGQTDQTTPLQLTGVTLIDSAGNVSNSKDGTDVNKTIDANSPTVPVITLPSSNPYEIITATKSILTLIGTAEASSTIKLFVDGIDSNVSISANESGDFNFSNANLTTAGIVSPTDYSTPKVVTLTATDAVGNTSIATSDFNFTQQTDETPPEFTLSYYSDIALSNKLTTPVYLKAGTYYVKVEANEALQATPTYLIDAEGTANDVSLQTMTFISGNTYKFTRTITADEAAIGAVVEKVTVNASDVSGNAVTNLVLSDSAFTDTTAPTQPTISSPENNVVITTTTTTVSGSAESNTTVSVYVKGLFKSSDTATSGLYSVSDVSLASGQNTIYVKAVDRAGNESIDSSSITIKRVRNSRSSGGGGSPSGGSTKEGVKHIEILNYQILTQIKGTKGEKIKLEVALTNITGFSVDSNNLKVEFVSDCSDCFSFEIPSVSSETLKPYEPINILVYATVLKKLNAGSYKINAVIKFRKELADTRTMTLVVSESKSEQTMPVIVREIKHKKNYLKETNGFRTSLYDYPSSVIVLKIKNHTSKEMKDVHVRETIPKSVLNNIFDTIYDKKTRKEIPKIIFNGEYVVINPDPVIEWVIDTLSPGQEVEVGYEVLEVEANSEEFVDPLTTIEGTTKQPNDNKKPSLPIDQKQVCGDNVCQEGENKTNCCSDCGCINSSLTCQNNKCVVLIDIPEEKTPLPEKEPVVSTGQESYMISSVIGLLLFLLLVILILKRNTILDKWNDAVFNYKYRKTKKKVQNKKNHLK